jgi:hypothetical protein
LQPQRALLGPKLEPLFFLFEEKNWSHYCVHLGKTEPNQFAVTAKKNPQDCFLFLLCNPTSITKQLTIQSTEQLKTIYVNIYVIKLLGHVCFSL